MRKEAPWDMTYADDLVISKETGEEVERSLGKWMKTLENKGMRVSRQKTEYLCIDGGMDVGWEIEMQGQRLSRVKILSI